jgi:hypothetical protein
VVFLSGDETVLLFYCLFIYVLQLEIKLSIGKGWRSSYQEGRVGDQVIKREGLEIKLSRGKGWRSSYLEGRVGDQVIKREGLEIKLSRGKGWDPINLFNQTTFLCQSQAGPGFPTSYVVIFFVFSEFS